MKYYKPIEKIYEHLLQSNGDITTKEELINGLVGQLKVFFNDDEREINVIDESVVRELLVKIYTEYEEYLTSGLSVSEQYLKASILKNQKSESKRQMIKYRFEITMTEKCLRYIIDEYSKLENQELKEDFMCKWIDCLTLVESMGDEYKEVYAQNMMRVCQDIIREEYEVLNPVWRNYFSLCVKYKCGLETK